MGSRLGSSGGILLEDSMDMFSGCLQRGSSAAVFLALQNQGNCASRLMIEFRR